MKNSKVSDRLVCHAPVTLERQNGGEIGRKLDQAYEDGNDLVAVNAGRNCYCTLTTRITGTIMYFVLLVVLPRPLPFPFELPLPVWRTD